MLLLLGAGWKTAIAVALIGNLGRQAMQLHKALCGSLVEGIAGVIGGKIKGCLLYTSDAADDVYQV